MQQANDALAALGRQDHGYDGSEHLRERGEVVAGRPAAELEQVGRHEGIRVQHVEDGAELAGWRDVDEAGHHARARLPPERHADPHAGSDERAQRLGHAIGEEVVQRHGRERCNLDEAVHPWPAC